MYLFIISIIQINDAVSNWNSIFRKRFFFKKKKNTNLSLPPFKSAAKICININGFAFFSSAKADKGSGRTRMGKLFSLSLSHTGLCFLEMCKPKVRPDTF